MILVGTVTMGKRKNKPRHNPPKRNVGVFVRSPGCKGTSVDFIPVNGGCKVVVSDSTGEGEAFLSKEDLRYLLGDT